LFANVDASAGRKAEALSASRREAMAKAGAANAAAVEAVLAEEFGDIDVAEEIRRMKLEEEAWTSSGGGGGSGKWSRGAGAGASGAPSHPTVRMGPAEEGIPRLPLRSAVDGGGFGEGGGLFGGGSRRGGGDVTGTGVTITGHTGGAGEGTRVAGSTRGGGGGGAGAGVAAAGIGNSSAASSANTGLGWLVAGGGSDLGGPALGTVVVDDHDSSSDSEDD
jgi:hypothetical protein